MYDLITVGRVNMDLYSREVGAPFSEVRSFDAMIGGSPSNIAIATSRLGLRSVAFTGVGDDRVGEFVLRNFAEEGVITDYVAVKPGKLTSLALLGVQPPDHFPLSFYREDPADVHLTVADAEALPWDEVRAVELSGNALSRGTCAEATRFCAEEAHRRGLMSFLDLDLRPVEWSDPHSFGLVQRSVLPLVEVVIGTEEELYAALAPHADPVMGGGRVPEADLGALDEWTRTLVSGPGGPSVVALKRGPNGVSIITADDVLDVAGFPVEVLNTVGAGDAFASGLIRSRLAGWDWYRAARFANACGAIEVTRHGCSAAFPTEPEVTAFIEEHGGY